MASDRSWTLELLKKIEEDFKTNPCRQPEFELCKIIRTLCEKTLDNIERCGCRANYPKWSCPCCECPTCHRKKDS